jgi:hypothetical protein
MSIIVKKTAWDCSRLLFVIAAGSLMVLLVAVSRKPATAQSADAQERCTGDVMRLCSEFVPDADAIVVCLKAKRLELTSSCLRALSPAPLEPMALQVSPTKKVQNVRRTVSSVAAARSTRIPHQAIRPKAGVGLRFN